MEILKRIWSLPLRVWIIFWLIVVAFFLLKEFIVIFQTGYYSYIPPTLLFELIVFLACYVPAFIVEIFKKYFMQDEYEFDLREITKEALVFNIISHIFPSIFLFIIEIVLLLIPF